MAHNQDFISLLPETLLTTILTFLTLKEAVRTSILSKHWRNQWCFRSDVEIDERRFLPHYHANETQVETLTRQLACIKFGRNWLKARKHDDHTLSSFNLIFSDPSGFEDDMDSFIRFAIDRQTKSLELDFSAFQWVNSFPISESNRYAERFDLPDIAYQYQGLESLKLYSCGFQHDLLKTLGLTLKSVSLGWIEMTENTLKNLIKSCPCLESLSLFKCFNTTVFVIESEKLKRLKVDKCVDILNLTVLASNLESFTYYGKIVEFGFTVFPSIQEADIDLTLNYPHINVAGADDLADLLSRFYFAKSLRVCYYIAQVFPMAPTSPRIAGRPKVKELIIATIFQGHEFYGIFALFKNFPLIEKCCFEVRPQDIFDRNPALRTTFLPPETSWRTTHPLGGGEVPKGLEIVEVKGYKGSPNENHVLRIIIKEGPAMRQIILYPGRNDERATRAALQLKTALANEASHIDVLVICLDVVSFNS